MFCTSQNYTQISEKLLHPPGRVQYIPEIHSHGFHISLKACMGCTFCEFELHSDAFLSVWSSLAHVLGESLHGRLGNWNGYLLTGEQVTLR